MEIPTRNDVLSGEHSFRTSQIFLRSVHEVDTYGMSGTNAFNFFPHFLAGFVPANYESKVEMPSLKNMAFQVFRRQHNISFRAAQNPLTSVLRLMICAVLLRDPGKKTMALPGP